MSSQTSHTAARAVVFTGPDQVELRPFTLRKPGPGEILVESAYTCISPGTEIRRLSGREMVGASEFPLVPGYCLAGRVVEAGPETATPLGAAVVTFGSSEVGEFHPGEGGHVSHALMQADLAVPVPDGVDLLDASASVLAGIAWHGVRKAHVGAGDRVAVIGLGVIGQMAARVCVAKGADVIGCDRIENRVAALSAAGVRAVISGGTLKQAFSPLFPEGVDVIVDSTGASNIMEDALALARQSAWDPLQDMPSVRYVMLGSPKEDLRIPYAAAYATQCAILFSSGSQLSDCADMLELIARGQLDVRSAITDVRPPEAAAAAYLELADPSTGPLTVAFKWR